MKLYEIDDAILACVDPETGEADEDKLNALLMERNVKIESIALWIKNLLADAAEIKQEEKAFAERRKAKENRAESLRKYLAGYLDGQKFETAKVAVSFRHSKRVEVTDMSKLSDEYMRYKEPEVDKKKLMEELKAGIKIDGAELVDNVSMTIK